MRVAAVGIVLMFQSGEIFIQRRSKNAAHVPGVIDSSRAGLCTVEKDTINYLTCLHEKIENELQLKPNEIKIEGVSGIHSTNKPDLSCTVDVIVKTSVNKEEFLQRIKDNFEEFFIVNKKELLHFILKHLDKYLGLEGLATLLTALDSRDRKKLIKFVKKDIEKIIFGELCKGIVKHTEDYPLKN